MPEQLSSYDYVCMCGREWREAEDIKDCFRMYTGFMLLTIILVSFKDQYKRSEVLIDSGRDNINI